MPLLNEHQQTAFLALLLRGASAVLACRELDVPHAQYLATLRQDVEFRARVHDVECLLSGNVSASLYKSALEGKVNAQTFYLRNHPRLETDPQISADDDDTLRPDIPYSDLRQIWNADMNDPDSPQEK